MTSFLSALLLSANALAVPAQFTHQGRLVQPDGTPMTGEVSITFRVMNAETDGTPLWEEAISVSLNNGFYAAVLGANEVDNPLDVDVLKQAPVWLELQVGDEAAMSPRSAIQSVPYATIATEVVGGAVDASNLSIDGSVVVDESGQWVGAAPTVNWADIEDVPPDAFTELGTSCVTGDIPVWNEFTAMWDCEMDQDTLASTSCSDGQILVYQMASGTWDCGTDTNTTLSAPEVQAMVEAMTTLALQSGTTVGGSAVLTESGHAADANAHHSSTSDGLHITPASVTLSDSDTQLVDGKIDLGSEGDDALMAWMLKAQPHLSEDEQRARMDAPDEGAQYDGGVHTIDLSSIVPMVAHPGNPDEGIPSDPTNGANISKIK